MNTEYNPEVPRQAEESFKDQGADQPIQQSVDQARLANQVLSQEGSTMPPNQAGAEVVQASIKPENMPMTPEMQINNQLTGQAQAQSEPVLTPQPTAPALHVQHTDQAQPVVVAAPAAALQFPTQEAQQPMQTVQATQEQPQTQVLAQNTAPQPVYAQVAAPVDTSVAAAQPAQPIVQNGAILPQTQMTNLAAEPQQQPAQPVPAVEQGHQRTLPPMRVRKNSENLIFLDADTYQTAILNVLLPMGIKLETEDYVQKQSRKQKEKEKMILSKRAQEERAEKQRQKVEAQAKKRQEAEQLKQQRAAENKEKIRMQKMEAENMAAAKRAEAAAQMEARRQQQALASATRVTEMNAVGTAKVDGMPRQESMSSAANGDIEMQNGRNSARGKPRQDFKAMHRGTSNDFGKGSFAGKAVSPIASKSGAQASARQRGIQVHKANMKACQDLLMAVRDLCKKHEINLLLQNTPQYEEYNKTVNNIEAIENNLKDFKYMSTNDMIAAVKESIMQCLKLGQKNPECYPKVMNLLDQTNTLITNAKLSDKSIFSQATTSMQAPSRTGSMAVDAQLNKQLSKKDKELQRLQAQIAKMSSKEKSKKKPVAQKTEGPKGGSQVSKGSNGTVGGAKAAPVRTDEALTVEERDNLIRQINSLTNQQSEGIIQIVQEFAQRDDNNQVTFELTQLPIHLCRNLEKYVKDCISQNEKKAKRKEKDAQRRVKKREEQRQKQAQTMGGSTQMAAGHQVTAPQQVAQSIVAQAGTIGDNRAGQASQHTQRIGIPQSQPQVISMNTTAPAAQVVQNQQLKPQVSQPQTINMQVAPQQQLAQQPQQSFTAQAQGGFGANQMAQAINIQQQLQQQTTQPAAATQQQSAQQVIAGQLTAAQATFNQVQFGQQQTPATTVPQGQQQFHAQPQQVQQQVMTFEQMDNETLLQHMLANPQLVRSQLSQQRINDLENFKLQQQQQSNFQQAQQQTNFQPQQLQTQQPAQQQVQQQQQIAQAVLQNQLAQQQQQLQQMQQMHQLQQQQQVQTVMQPATTTQAQQPMQQMQPAQQQQQIQQMQQQIALHANNQQLGKQQQLRQDDDSDSSSSDSDEEENGQPGGAINAGMLQQNMMNTAQNNQQMGGESDITKMWQNNDKQ